MVPARILAGSEVIDQVRGETLVQGGMAVFLWYEGVSNKHTYPHDGIVDQEKPADLGTGNCGSSPTYRMIAGAIPL